MTAVRTDAVLKAAFACWHAGISVVPTRRDKLPEASVLPINPETGKRGWKELQDRLATEDEMQGWFGNGHSVFGYATIAGAVSANLEIIDFDNPEGWPPETAEQTLAAFAAKVELKQPGLMSRLSLAATMSNGRHLRYRCETPVDGNLQLANVPALDEDGEFQINDKGNIVAAKLIETRGEGGYAVGPGTPGYAHLSGPDSWELATITTAEREILLSVARSFNQLASPHDDAAEILRENLFGEDLPAAGSGRRAGDVFNEQGAWAPLLDSLGLKFRFKDKSGVSYYQRIGSKNPIGATLNFAGKDLLHVFSTNLDIPSDKSYSKFAVYTLLHHGGNFTAAAKALIADGYGKGDTRPKPTQDAPAQSDGRNEVVLNAAYHWWELYAEAKKAAWIFTDPGISAEICRIAGSINKSQCAPPLDDQELQALLESARKKKQEEFYKTKEDEGPRYAKHGLEFRDGEWWPGSWELTILMGEEGTYFLKVPVWESLINNESRQVTLTATEYRDANAVADIVFKATKVIILDDKPGVWPAIWNGSKGSIKDKRPATVGLKSKLVDKASREEASAEWKRQVQLAELLLDKIEQARERDVPDKRGTPTKMPDGLIWVRWLKLWENELSLRMVTAHELRMLSRAVGVTPKHSKMWPSTVAAGESRVRYTTLDAAILGKIRKLCDTP